MTVVALTHGYIRTHAMGGEVSLHRALCALDGDKHVLTNTPEPYEVDGVNVSQINTPDVLNVQADPDPIAAQLEQLGARVVIGQNELSLPAVRAARMIGAQSVVYVHTPPKYGRSTREAVRQADHVVFNTVTSAKEWRKPNSLVLHPPISPLPRKTSPKGDAYTLLSSLLNKGVTVALELAARFPDRRFIIVRSPAEATHGITDLEERAAALPNVELHPRVTPDRVAAEYLSQTRILMIPSRSETYGMSAIEAAGYSIPSVSIMNAHVAEGIGEAAYGTGPLDVNGTETGIRTIEARYADYSHLARKRAEWIDARQRMELTTWADYVKTVKEQ